MRERIYRDIYRQIRIYQKRNRFVGTVEQGLSPVQAQLIVLIGEYADMSPKSVTAYLQLPKSSVTRFLRELEQEKYLKSYTAPEDSRSKLLTLSKKGESVLAAIHANANQRLNDFQNSLSKLQIEKFTSLMNRFSDGLGALPQEPTAQISKLRVAISRAARGLGITGRNVFHSATIDSFRWQILCQVAESRTGLTPGDLAKELTSAGNAISFALSNLQSHGMVSRIPHIHDGRSYWVVITEKGKQLLADVEAHALGLIESATSDFSVEELSEFSTLWAKFSGDSEVPGEILIQPRRSLRIAANESERSIFRRFLFEHFYFTQPQLTLPESMMIKSNICVALSEENEILAVAELALSETRARIENFALKPSESENTTGVDFLSYVVPFIAQNYQVQELSISDTLKAVPRMQPFVVHLENIYSSKVSNVAD